MKNSYLLHILLLAISSSIGFSQSPTGAIAGRIVTADGQAVANVNIVILGTTLGAVTDADGHFRIEQLNPGHYDLEIRCMGYQTVVKNDVIVQADRTSQLDISLTETVLPMPEIVVTPGNFSIAQSQSAAKQAIAKERIADIPATLDDIYRVLQIMPGVTFSDDYSAHFHVRGGKQNENLILLDGMEIYDPYHLKDIGGAVGIMNMDIIDNMSIMTGGFEARYGDRLSSVVAIENRQGSAERFRGNVVAGGTGLSTLIEGPIPAGSAILSFRKSFLKEAAEILNPTDYTFSPSYYDVQGKISLAANANNQIAINLLYSKDDSYLEKWRANSDLTFDYGNSYQGIVWKSTPSSRFFSEFILSRGVNFWDNSVGITREEKLNLTENVCSWNANYQPNAKHDIGYGLTFKDIRYQYELRAPELSEDQRELEDVVQSYFGAQKISSRTHKLGLYLQDKLRLSTALVMNIGLRYDAFAYNQDQQLSPRVGISYQIKNKTVLRAAWGQYHQAPIYAELTNVKGADHNPAGQRSIHYVVGIEQFLHEDFSVRIESYFKTMEQMIGHYFEMDDQADQPELRYGNPNSGSCRGVEFFINGRLSRNFSIWAAYAYSRAEIEAYFVNWQELKIEKQTIPRFTDQPHNLSLFLNYSLPRSWEFNVKWRYLTGIPYTPYYAQFSSGEPSWQYGDYYSARYPAYHRLDVRVGKNINFNNFQLATFLEIKNLYNRQNVLLYDYRIENGRHVRKAFYTLPFLPTIEFKVSF